MPMRWPVYAFRYPNGDKARQLPTEAIAMYRKIGMPRHVEMAEAMLGKV